MAKTQRFAFLCTDDERRIVAEIARRLERNQSDAMRWLIREAADSAAQNETPTTGNLGGTTVIGAESTHIP